MSSSHSDGDLSPNASARLPDHSPSAAGYPRLADFMSKAPETQIFRSFSHLNILNVLRLQAELHSLGQQLAAFQRNNPEHTRNFWAMRMNKEDGIEDEQGDLLELIDAKLERYNSALLQLHQLRGMQTPMRQDMNTLLDYLRGFTGERFLQDPESDLWPSPSSPNFREQINEGYITTDPRASKRDYFSILLEGRLLDIYHGFRRWLKRDQSAEEASEERFTTYSAHHLEAISTSIAVAVSSFLPFLAIIILYYVQTMIVRIVLVLVFTTLFSALLRIFTAARTAEIYAATAAFAAIEVVFIGSDNLKT